MTKDSILRIYLALIHNIFLKHELLKHFSLKKLENTRQIDYLTD